MDIDWDGVAGVALAIGFAVFLDRPRLQGLNLINTTKHKEGK